jgi:hypothetical protein
MSEYGDSLPVFYIGQHESKRALDVSAELVQHAQDLGVGVPPSLPPHSTTN